MIFRLIVMSYMLIGVSIAAYFEYKNSLLPPRKLEDFTCWAVTIVGWPLVLLALFLKGKTK